ncbi:MAG: NAD-dependent epimerase/dehydratase family protein [Gammaproteobacteria bacterium]
MFDCIIIGCGYVGRRVAALEQAAGRSVLGVVRSADSAAALAASGIEARTADLDQPESLAPLPLAGATVYYLAPPPPRGDRDPRMEGFVGILRRSGVPDRVVLISTTGVYGDCAGEWVDEQRTPRPQADRARRRLAAEETLRQWGRDQRAAVVVLRVPGIYGPGRLPVTRLRQGLPVLREAEAPFSNRVHVDDLARACLAAARRGANGAVYNVSDGAPSTMTDYFNRVADAVGLPRPPQISLEQARRELSPGMLSYLAESKRLDTRRMREELGVIPEFGDLGAGLRASVGGTGETPPG